MDKIQRALIKVGRRDLAQKYYLKVAAGDSLSKKVLDEIKKSRTYMDIDESKDTFILLTTRRHGDVGSEQHGSKDLNEAKRVGKLIKDKFKDSVKINIEVVDEWIHLNMTITPYQGYSESEMLDIMKKSLPLVKSVFPKKLFNVKNNTWTNGYGGFSIAQVEIWYWHIDKMWEKKPQYWNPTHGEFSVGLMASPTEGMYAIVLTDDDGLYGTTKNLNREKLKSLSRSDISAGLKKLYRRLDKILFKGGNYKIISENELK